MMLEVWKFKLEETIEMPKGARIIHVGFQRGTLYVWALVDSTAPKETRNFLIYSTGDVFPIKEGISAEMLSHLGTFLLDEDKIVVHVFEVEQK